MPLYLHVHCMVFKQRIKWWYGLFQACRCIGTSVERWRSWWKLLTTIHHVMTWCYNWWMVVIRNITNQLMPYWGMTDTVRSLASMMLYGLFSGFEITWKMWNTCIFSPQPLVFFSKEHVIQLAKIITMDLANIVPGTGDWILYILDTLCMIIQKGKLLRLFLVPNR